MGSSQTIAWPNTVLNTIAAESLDYMATELEKVAGKTPTPARLQAAVLSVLKKVIRQHKRVIFGGDNYSAEWHDEAEQRGLPHFRDSVEAFAVLRQKKIADLFKKYGVLSKAELDSRTHIAYEKYIKQIDIEAQTMITHGAHDDPARGAAASGQGCPGGVGDRGGRGQVRGYSPGAGRVRQPGLPVPGSTGPAWRRRSLTRMATRSSTRSGSRTR